MNVFMIRRRDSDDFFYKGKIYKGKIFPKWTVQKNGKIWKSFKEVVATIHKYELREVDIETYCLVLEKTEDIKLKPKSKNTKRPPHEDID